MHFYITDYSIYNTILVMWHDVEFGAMSRFVAHNNVCGGGGGGGWGRSGSFGVVWRHWVMVFGCDNGCWWSRGGVWVCLVLC